MYGLPDGGQKVLDQEASLLYRLTSLLHRLTLHILIVTNSLVYAAPGMWSAVHKLPIES